MTCCLLVEDEEDVEADEEQFHCDDCPLAAEIDALVPENRYVWHLYQHLASRIAVDVHCGATVLQRLTSDLDADEFADVWKRLRMFYEMANPPADPADPKDG